MRSRLSLIVAASALAAALLSGCTGEPAPVASTPTIATEDEAFAAAEQTYRNYVDALNQVDLSDPATFEPVYAWTTGELNAADRKQFTQMHADGLTVSGESRVLLLLPRVLDASNGGARELNVCVDVGDVELVDAGGTSVVSPDRTDVQSTVVTAVPSATSSTGWLLSSVAGREGEPLCS